MTDPPSPPASQSPTETNTHALNATSYNTIAPFYLSWSLSNQPSPTNNPRLIYLNKLLSLLPSPSTARVIDLGCGAGVPCTQLLAKTCHRGRVVGVDSSSKQIELARKYVLGSTKGRGRSRPKDVSEGAGDDGPDSEIDMTSLNFPRGSFDAVVAFYSVIHLPRDEQRQLLKQIAEWLVSEDTEKVEQGYLLLNLGTTDNQGDCAENWNGWKGGNLFWSSFDSATNLEMLKESGFQIVESLVVEDEENGRSVPFLWILAKKE
jgi:SAM-dependent methyltransferase